MVNNNNPIIPPIEEISYLDTEIPSFEELMKTYESDKKIIFITNQNVFFVGIVFKVNLLIDLD